MIKSLELKFFRKHEDTKLDFTTGLNVLRGPNEVGKTTVTEGILYALYGAASLCDTLAEIVTWGQKESALKSTLTISISSQEYVFTRSKAGAECNYSVDGKAVKVTGQKEVTAFAAALLGADAKTAGVLMLASQAGLRGALDSGATAVGELMGKLADFDTIDRILKNAAETLALGSIVPLQAKLAEADAEVLDATNDQVDPSVLAALNQQIATATETHRVAVAAQEALSAAVEKADAARDAASLNNGAWEHAQNLVASSRAKLEAERLKLSAAVADVEKRPAAREITEARDALTVARNHTIVSQAYQKFSTLGAYPPISWDKDKFSFDAEVAKITAERDAASLRVRELTSDITSLRKTLTAGDGKCPTCGHLAESHDHVTQRNAEIEAQAATFDLERLKASTLVVTANNDLADLNLVRKQAQRRDDICADIRQYLIFDGSCYPPTVQWNGPTPDADNANLGVAMTTLRDLEARDASALQAEGRATAHRAQVAELESSLASAMVSAAGMAIILVGPLQEAYDAAFTAYAEQGVVVREIAYRLSELRDEYAETLRLVTGAVARLETARLRVAEYVADIKTLEFNNDLVKKLKSLKPMITDHLWNNVLAAVSNFFSVLRGEQSIVTKDATGFKVNGRGGSLSGSTLDMLALAIRVALSKTFVPHANFMVLDEPAHGCDNVRAGSLLGFLASVGFQQTILASHDELSESVADNVILLGT